MTFFIKAKDKKQPETAPPGGRAVNYHIFVMWNGIFDEEQNITIISSHGMF